MSKTTVEIDYGLLESAKEVLGTSTIKDTIHAALTEVVRRKDRARAIDEIAGLVEAGDIDFGLPEEGTTTEDLASSLTAAEKRLAHLLDQDADDPAIHQAHRRSWTATTHLIRDIRGGEAWQVVGASEGAVVMRSGDSGLAIRVVDGTTLAASQAEAVHLAEQILKDIGAESSE